MEFLINDFLLKKTEEILFIELKNNMEFNIANYQLPSNGLDVPLITEELAENIKTKKENEVLTVTGIVRGMIYLLGIDPSFKYKDEYIKFLYAVNPKIERYILKSGLEFINEGKLIEGIIFLKTLILLNNYDIDGLFNYSLALLEYRDKQFLNKPKSYKLFTREARDKLEKLLNSDKKHGLAYYYLGYIYRENKEFNKAKIHWEEALKLELEENIKEEIRTLLSELEDMAQYELGYQAILSGRSQEGLSILIKLEEKYSTWWNLLFFIGLGYRQLNNFEKAVVYFERVLKLKENQIDTIVELGLSYGGLGEIQKSIDCFYKALDIGGENNEILCNLAMLYLELNNIGKAEEYINKSLEIDPNDEITLLCSNKIQEVKNNL
ncbi:MAG: tetratricopeptide repeat protein [Clostridiales bacterium]|nr:tetratricopeptide repeat protein [Clostridiales bacterium]